MQEFAPDLQACLDVTRAVEVRVVDEALPAEDGAWLLEIDAHHNFHAVGELLPQRHEVPRVIHRRHRVVDGARADDDQQAVVLSIENVSHRVPPGDDGLGDLLREREGLGQLARRDDGPGGLNVPVVRALHDENLLPVRKS